MQKLRSGFLVLTSLLGFGMAANLLLNPIGFAAGEGLTIDAAVATLAQAHGAGLLAVSLINLLAFRLTDPKGLRAILTGNLAFQLLSLGINLRALMLALIPPSAWGAIGFHVVFALGFAALLATARAPAPSAAAAPVRS